MVKLREIALPLAIFSIFDIKSGVFMKLKSIQADMIPK